MELNKKGHSVIQVQSFYGINLCRYPCNKLKLTKKQKQEQSCFQSIKLETKDTMDVVFLVRNVRLLNEKQVKC